MTRKEKRLMKFTAALLAFVVILAFAKIRTEVEKFERSMATAPAQREIPDIYDAPVVEPEAASVEFEPIPELVELGEFKLTAYCSCPKCCGEWADGITFTGTKATAGRTVAVDPDVIPLGSAVYIDGREYVAEDIGGAIQGNRIDIFFTSHADALEFGVQYAEVAVN